MKDFKSLPGKTQLAMLVLGFPVAVVAAPILLILSLACWPGMIAYGFAKKRDASDDMLGFCVLGAELWYGVGIWLTIWLVSIL